MVAFCDWLRYDTQDLGQTESKHTGKHKVDIHENVSMTFASITVLCSQLWRRGPEAQPDLLEETLKCFLYYWDKKVDLFLLTFNLWV